MIKQGSSFIRYLIAGGPGRLSRLHDCRGNFVGLPGLLDVPAAFATKLLVRVLSYRPKLPWIPYPAIRELERIIKPDWKVIEFGSGMSTLWLADRAAYIVSIESNERWYNYLKGRLATDASCREKVHYECRTAETYSDVSNFPDDYFDLAIVDGGPRADCAQAVIPKIKRGGWVYLDNADFTGPGYDGAEEFILDAVRNRNGSFRYFTGFAPAVLAAQQGLLAQL